LPTQAARVNGVDGITLAVRVQVDATGEAGRVGADEPANVGVVEARPDVQQPASDPALVFPASRPLEGCRVAAPLETRDPEGIEALGAEDQVAAALRRVAGAAQPVLVEVAVEAVLPLAHSRRVDGVARGVVEQPGAVAVDVLHPVDAGAYPLAARIVV